MPSLLRSCLICTFKANYTIDKFRTTTCSYQRRYVRGVTNVIAWKRVVENKKDEGDVQWNLQVEESKLAKNEERGKIKEDNSHVSQETQVEEEKIPVTAENQYEALAKAVTPFHDIPYPEQLQMKYRHCRNVLKQFAADLRKTNTKVNYIKQGLPCYLENVKPSPVIDAYRNKDEFNVRTGIDGNPKTVGFFVGSPVAGDVVCVNADYLINMRESHRKVARAYEHYIRSSPLEACHDFSGGGNWRNLLVRSTEKGEVMAVVLFHPRDLPREQIEEEQEKLKTYFVEGEGRECELTSLYFQACPHTRCTNDQAPFKLLHGEKYLIEDLSGRRFRISPDSFFQVNTKAAENLYQIIIEMTQVSSMTTVLDICCGTGTISILVSPYVRGTIGIENIYDAVKDARANATLNDVTNAEFIPGRAEVKLPKVLKEFDTASDVVAVVNPGRGGLHWRVVEAIRECHQIDRVVYVSCKPLGVSMNNFVELCTHKGKKKGKPFFLRHAVPVDMFPHTEHCELVLLFERER